jgi:hyperosmotically inducible periplasmic protein
MTHHLSVFSAFAFAWIALLAAPSAVTPQTTTEKMEQKVKSVAREVKTDVTDSWVTAKTKIALYADERVKGRQVSVETVNGTVMLRGKVDSDEARTAAASIAEGVEHVKAVKNDLQVVAARDLQATDISDKDITRQINERFSKTTQLTKIDVRADGGVVLLTGSVPTIGASARASELARGVSGVRAVKNELTYAPAERDHSSLSGSRGQVFAMQQALKDKGFDPGPIDGIEGPRTVSALKDYQKSEQVTMTGKLDAATAAKLGVSGPADKKRQAP